MLGEKRNAVDVYQEKLSFFHSNSHPVQLIFDPFKENVKPRLLPRRKAEKDIKDSSIFN